MKRALVQTGVASYFAPHARAEHAFEQVLLEPSNDRVTLQQIQDRGMALNNARAAIVLVVDELGHVTFAVTNVREPLRALCYGVPLRLGFEPRSLLFENAVKKLLRRAHFLRATPGIEVAVAVKGDAMLLNAHVAHVHSFHELVDGHSPGALE